MRIITNNPYVKSEIEKRELASVEYVDISYREVLTYVRDLVHKGYTVLTHPLSGSVKPNENFYRSIAVSDKPGKSLDLKSLEVIESAIETFDKFPKKEITVNSKTDYDMQFIEYTLISSIF